jgi:hypothetical protein
MPASLRPGSQRPPTGRLFHRTLRWLGLSSLVPIEKVRKLCLEVIDDVPSWNKQGLVWRITHLRRHADVPELKPHLFEMVSRYHGEREARTRINRLDSQLS